MTDYLDGELDAKREAEIRGHLEKCSTCRELFQAIQKVSAETFKPTPELKPDPEVWQKIQAQIESKKEPAWAWLQGLEEKLMPVLKAPQLVFRGAFAAALILIVVVMAKWPSTYMDPVYGYLDEQMTLMGELQSGNPDFLNGDLAEYEIFFGD